MGYFNKPGIVKVNKPLILSIILMILHEINTHTVYFQVKVATTDIGPGCEKEFHTTVFIDFSVCFTCNCPDIMIFHVENDINIISVILKFYLRFREMRWHFTHMVFQTDDISLVPESFVPICIDSRRLTR